MATIDEIRNLAEPLKGYQAIVTITNAPGSGASIEELQFLCQTFVLPGRDIDQVFQRLGGGHSRSDVGADTGPKTWTTTFAETTDASVIERISSWMEVCRSQSTGVQGSRADTHRVARIDILNNAKEITSTRRIIGIWPQSMADLAFDENSSEGVTLDVTWSYDYWENE